jgi:hypothetical protein
MLVMGDARRLSQGSGAQMRVSPPDDGIYAP